MKLLRETIRRVIKESIEDENSEMIENLMALWYNEEWEQVSTLAHDLELSRHPGLKIWNIFDGETGDIKIDGLNYDQATSAKYLAFAYTPFGYQNGTGVGGTDASKKHPSQADFDYAMDQMVSGTGITEPEPTIDEENFRVWVEY